MHRLFAAAAILSISFGFSDSVQADGFDRHQSYKDGPSVNYYSNAPTSYRSSYVAKCDRYLTRSECRRFRAKMAERAQGITENSRNRIRHVERRYYREDPRPTRYAASRYPRYDAEERGEGRRCKAPHKVVSKPMTIGACREAKRAWSIEVGDNFGGAWNDFRKAKVLKVEPKPLHYGAWREVCTVVARPCRED